MHPSQARAHHSTKKEDTGINLGFSDIGTSKPEPLTTPSKISMPPQSEFDFRFARPTESLGPEAKQMMAEIREEAQRIKAELQAKHEEEKAKNGDGTSSILGARKVAQPKGKAGRYSELHMNEFRKMDSIADHPSSFRGQPGRIPTMTISENKKSLKRTQSKADLGDDNQRAVKSTIKIVSETTSSRLENPSPSKRPRGLDAKDTSSYTKPVSKDVPSKIPSKPSTPSVSRTSKFLDMITTPTQSSLARSNSNIQLNSTPAKALQRSPSKIQMTPGMVKSATTNNLNNITSPAKPESTHRFADKMKSILRRGGQEQKEMAPPLSNIPIMSKSPSRANLNKELPTIPTTPSTSHLPRSKNMKSIKQVSFTPATIAKDIAQQSPTPIKSGLPRSKSNANPNSVAYPTLPVERSLKKQPGRFFVRPTEKPAEKIVGLDVEKIAEEDVEMPVSPTPEPAAEPAAKEPEPTVEYPGLPEIVEKSPSRPLSRSPVREEFAQPLPVPGLFTFTHGTQIKFGTPPRNNFGKNSPAAASIRKVRESLFSAPTDSMPGAFPGSNNKENRIPLEVPAIAHGFSNKKRARAASPSDDLVHGGDKGDYDEAEAERSPKKRKQVAAEGDMLVAPKLVAAKAAREAKAPKSLIPFPAKAAATAAANARANSKSPVKKGGLTMSRLKALAAPKRRV